MNVSGRILRVVSFAVFISGWAVAAWLFVRAASNQNAERKNVTPVSLRVDAAPTNESPTKNANLSDLLFLAEPVDSAAGFSFEERSATLREHLLLSIRRRANLEDGPLVAPEWMLNVLDEAVREIRNLSTQLGDKYRAEREELPYRHPTTHLTCPYTGQMRPAPSR